MDDTTRLTLFSVPSCAWPSPKKKLENAGNRIDYATLHSTSLTADAPDEEGRRVRGGRRDIRFYVYFVADAVPLCANTIRRR
jgi:hypothetical protein